jgi:EAL domain-containing protein (putative c-di-GMP-specific phosphodiesterase class I)
VGSDERKTALFGAIVRMAHALDLVVIAEGIEEAAQLDCIRRCGCDGAQGYLLSRPISAEGVESMFLTEWKDGLLPATSH